MGLSVIFVSGPRRCGKSAIISAMVDQLFKQPPHYLRLVLSGSDKKAPRTKPAARECGVASATWLDYCADRIFEVLPEALSSIHERDRFGTVLIEADSDPILRCAFPYDRRIFVMPTPCQVDDIFRNPVQAADELKRALDDTAAFAEEIFGLFAQGADDSDFREARPNLTASQARGFLQSPLGDELATRIQLQPPYHGLVESDLVVVNASVGSAGPETPQCLQRINHLLARMRRAAAARAEVFLCDLSDCSSQDGRKLMKALKPLCDGRG